MIALDLKGFNDSDKPSSRSEYSPQKICTEISAFIRALNVTSATVMGHDLGAILGWILVQTNPEVVNRLICVSAPHPNLLWIFQVHPKKTEIGLSWLRLVQLPWIPEKEIMDNDSQFLNRCLGHLTAKKQPSGKDSDSKLGESNSASLIDAYGYVFSRKSDWTGPLNYYRNFPFYRIREAPAGETNSFMISCPCLIVTGNEDPMYRLESIVNSSEYCDNAVVKIVEGARHWPHQEMPDEFNKIVLKYLVGEKMNGS